MKIEYDYKDASSSYNANVHQSPYLEDDEDWIYYRNWVQRNIASKYHTEEECSAFMNGIALGYEMAIRPYKRVESLVA